MIHLGLWKLRIPRDPLGTGLVGPEVAGPRLGEGAAGRQHESAFPGPGEHVGMRRPCGRHPGSKAPGDNGKNCCIAGRMGHGTRGWTQKEWAQPSSTAYQPRDLKGYLTSPGPGFPIINSLSGRSRELREVPMHSGMLGQLPPPASPSILSLPTVCFSLGLVSRGRGEHENTVSTSRGRGSGMSSILGTTF